jgi:hypothetical protein
MQFHTARIKKQVNGASYMTETNQRLGYSVCFDPSLFNHRRTSPKGEEEVWESRDGHASFKVESAKPDPRGLSQFYVEDLSSFSHPESGAIINKNESYPDWFEIKATSEKSQEFELGTLRKGNVTRMFIQYDVDSDRIYRASAEHMLECFHNSSPN